MEANRRAWKNHNTNFNSKKLSNKTALFALDLCRRLNLHEQFNFMYKARSSLSSWKITGHSSICTLHTLNHEATDIIQ